MAGECRTGELLSKTRTARVGLTHEWPVSIENTLEYRTKYAQEYDLATFTKNQHYVPRLLLRNFATEHRKVYRIHLLDLARSDFRPNQSVANVCSENYFYDKDNAIEQFVEQNVETPAAGEIQALCSANPIIEASPSREVSRFISVQIARTAEALNQFQVFLNGMTKTMFREMARLNGFDEDAAEKARLVPTEPHLVSSRLALNGCIAWLLIHDLKQHLIINESPREFFISDHPVVHSNLYLHGLNIFSSGSLSVAGAQIFVPISTRRLLCLYDSRIYKYGSKGSRISTTSSLDTVTALNVLQIRNSPQALMFRSLEDREDIHRLAGRWRHRPLWEHKSFFNPAQDIGRGKLKSLHAVAKIQGTPEVRLPFFKMKNAIRRRPPRAEDRIPAAIEAFEQMMKKGTSIKELNSN